MNNNLITGVLAGVSGVLSYIFGPWDAMIMVLIAVVALDYITGVAYPAARNPLLWSMSPHHPDLWHPHRRW